MAWQTIGRRRPSYRSSATDRKSLNSLSFSRNIPYENLQGIWAVNAKTYDLPAILILRASERSAHDVPRAERIGCLPYISLIDLSTTTINPLLAPHAPACDPWRETGLGADDPAGSAGDISVPGQLDSLDRFPKGSLARARMAKICKNYPNYPNCPSNR